VEITFFTRSSWNNTQGHTDNNVESLKPTVECPIQQTVNTDIPEKVIGYPIPILLEYFNELSDKTEDTEKHRASHDQITSPFQP
jgi:hypothetical protein